MEIHGPLPIHLFRDLKAAAGGEIEPHAMGAFTFAVREYHAQQGCRLYREDSPAYESERPPTRRD